MFEKRGCRLNLSASPHHYSDQVAQLQCQGQQCNGAEAKTWNGGPVLLSSIQIQEFNIAAKEQDGVGVRKQDNERVEDWEAWPKQCHHKP
eukprot:6217371-Amphidinium_carterae.1